MLIDHHTEFNGFQAGLYQVEGTNNLIVSFGGTTSSPESYTKLSKYTDTIMDFLQDVTLVSNFPFKPNQAQSAINYINKVQQNFSSRGTISAIVGHSLGGGLAQYAGLYYGIKTVTFNTSPMPFNNNSIAIFSKNGKIIDNEGIFDRRITFLNKDVITNVMTKNDPLTLIANSIMSLDESAIGVIGTTLLKEKMGVQTQLSLDFLIVGEQIRLPMKTGHSMEEIYETMKVIVNAFSDL